MKLVGTIQKSELEGGLWMLVTEAGEQYQLVGAKGIRAGQEVVVEGKMDRNAALDASMRLTVGSDVAGGPDRSMVRVARSMLETAKRLHHRPPSAAQAWHAITAGNADELAKACCIAAGGLGGSLTPGTAADLLVLRPDIRLEHSPDPLAALLYAWDDRWLRYTLTGGQIRWNASESQKV